VKINEKINTSFWIKVSLALLTGTLLVVTLISREWIEIVFGIEPDGGSGALEWAIVAALFLATVVVTLSARSEWIRLHSS
jgi:O-antigen/teichoic acid export membrane protein